MPSVLLRLRAPVGTEPDPPGIGYGRTRTEAKGLEGRPPCRPAFCGCWNRSGRSPTLQGSDAKRGVVSR